jgi:hypothetical protein
LAKKVSAVLTPEKVDMETDERDNITVDMKMPANEYEFQKLNDDFDRKLGRLRGAYKRKADEILHADRYGLHMAKRRNCLWMWFDRKTKFRIFPKILLGLTALTVMAIVCYFESASFPHLFGDYRPDDCMGVFILVPALVIEILCCIAVFSSGQGNQEFPIYLDVVTNPAFKDLECNVYHEEPSKHR